MSTTPRVGIIVLNWNNTQDTLECLASVVASDYPDIDPIVVDNGSDDFPEVLIRQRFPAVQIARQRFNRGYAGGNNAGIAAALAAFTTCARSMSGWLSAILSRTEPLKSVDSCNTTPN